MKNKWQELDSLDLCGFICFMREKKGKKLIYHFQRKEAAGYTYIKSEFDNIEWQLKNGWTIK